MATNKLDLSVKVKEKKDRIITELGGDLSSILGTDYIEVGEKLFDTTGAMGTIYILGRIGQGAMAHIYKAAQIISSGSEEENVALIKKLAETTAIEDVIFRLEKMLSEYERGRKSFGLWHITKCQEAIKYLEGMLKEKLPVNSMEDIKAIAYENNLKSRARLVAPKVLLEEELRKEKLLKPNFNPDEMKGLFRNETEIMAELGNAPYTRQLILNFENEKGLWIVQEFLDGENLKKILSGSVEAQHYRQLAPELVFAVAFYLAQALDYAHGRRIVHRDIKPGNIVLTYTGEVKLTDWGVAIKYNPEEKDILIAGTPGYFPPSITKAESYAPDTRDDIFSTGAALYELLTGRKPFGGYDQESYSKAVLDERPKPLVEHRIIISPEMEKVVLKCLEKDPEKRYQTASELLNNIVSLRGIDTSQFKKHILDGLRIDSIQREKRYATTQSKEIDGGTFTGTFI